MDLNEKEDIFISCGGRFISSAFDIGEKLKKIKAYVFDWDGVFNDGRKGEGVFSSFSEIDSLGVNMLRFGHYLEHGVMPVTAIITGKQNPSALTWAKREHIDAVYLRFAQKQMALTDFCDNHNLKPEEVCYLFDDILDVAVARSVGLGFAVGRKANPLFIRYLEKEGLADYVSGASGNQHAVREFCELVLLLIDKHFEVIQRRADYDQLYQEYYAQRQTLRLLQYEYRDNLIVPYKHI
mgnify:CR=1 FL=1